MKKLVITTAIVLGFAMGTYAEGIFQNNNNNGGGLYGRGEVQRITETGSPFIPAHGNDINADADAPHLPIGSGALLLVGFGAAYAMSKKNKKD